MKKIFFVIIGMILLTGVSAQQFPTVVCETMNDKKVVIPDDVKGKKTVVAVAMSAKAEKALRMWNTPSNTNGTEAGGKTLNVLLVRERLDKLDSLMTQAEDDKQWDCLSRAYERMFRVWCTLTKTPGPGNLKPTAPRQTQRRAIEPVVPVEPSIPVATHGTAAAPSTYGVAHGEPEPNG